MLGYRQGIIPQGVYGTVAESSWVLVIEVRPEAVVAAWGLTLESGKGGFGGLKLDPSAPPLSL